MANRGRGTVIGLAALAAAGLAVDAYVHLDLASAFRHNRTSTLSEAELFRLQAGVAIVAAVAVLLRPRRYTAAFALLVAGAALVAVLVTRYVDVSRIGPVPDLYDPYWQPTGKWVSAVAEAVATLAALALLALLSARGTRASRSGVAHRPVLGSRRD